MKLKNDVDGGKRSVLTETADNLVRIAFIMKYTAEMMARLSCLSD